MLTVAEARRIGRAALAEMETSALDADVLLCHVLGWTRADLFARDGMALTHEQVSSYERLLESRRRHEPNAYIVGEKEWFGLRLQVNHEVLIPRPETEGLAELAIKTMRTVVAGTPNNITVVDVGTGSGALAIAVAMALPEINIIAVDLNPGALKIARANAGRHGVSERIQFRESDLLSSIVDEPDMIVANLPYVPDGEWESLSPEVRHEPKLALVGGKRGLDLVERLLDQVAVRGWRLIILLELDPRQREPLTEMATAKLPTAQVTWRQDLTGRDRVAVIDFPESPSRAQ